MLSARDAMDRNYAQPLDVAALARIACVSEAHFIRTFRATFGETPHRYLQRRRVERSMFLLQVPGPPSMDEATAERVRELVSKGAAGGWIGFTTADCRKTYAELLARGVEFTQEPVEQFYGIDCGLRDPFGNAIRIVQPAPTPLQVPMPPKQT